MTIKCKDKQRLCMIFAFPGNDPSLLGMPDIKLLDILDVKCSTIHQRHKSGDINQQHEGKKSQASKDSNTNATVSNKDKYKIKYFVAGPEKEAYKEASAKPRESIPINLSMYSLLIY